MNGKQPRLETETDSGSWCLFLLLVLLFVAGSQAVVVALDGDSCLVEAPKLDPSRARWAAGKSDITTKQQLHFFLSLSLSLRAFSLCRGLALVLAAVGAGFGQ